MYNFRHLGKDRLHRQTPLPALAVRKLVQQLDPRSVADLILRAVILVGFSCLFRPNSYQLLRWRHVTFETRKDADGSYHLEVLVTVPDNKAVVYAAAVGGVGRTVRLKEFHTLEFCAARTLYAVALKMGIFDSKQQFVMKPECSDQFVFPAVVGGVLIPHKTVRKGVEIIA